MMPGTNTAMDFLEGDLENPKEINDNKIVVNKSIFFMSLNIVLYKTNVKPKYKKICYSREKYPWPTGMMLSRSIFHSVADFFIFLFSARGI